MKCKFQGTVNPTHFVVLDHALDPEKENETTVDPVSVDLMQRFAYVTCFMYYNWSGTVRVPAMVQVGNN